MTTALLDAVEFKPRSTPRASVIWLHGLGADGHDFAPLISQLGIVQEYAVRVLLPHAPSRPVTINGGMVMPAWYDIPSTDFGHAQDAAGIRASQAQLAALVEREIASGIAPQHIILAGFSQGGAIVLHTGLRYPQQLGGILALSTYLPLADHLPGEATPANRSIPVLLAHGLSDPVVPITLALQTRDILVRHGCQVEWHSYPMQHSVCPEEVQDIRNWLVSRLEAV
jgi:phospholipase/carboxylesterase